VDLVGIGPSGTGRRDMQERLQARRLQICFPERGHQTGVYLLPKDQPTPVAYQHSPVVSEYFRHCEEERRRRRGEWGRLTGSPGEIFPNTALHPRQPRTIAVWHPRGAHQTEVWRWYLVDQEAPPEVKDFLRQYYIRYSGPGGLTEQDDMENWNYAHAASRGTIARRYPYSYEQGMGFEVQNFAWDGLQLPGVVMDITEAKSSEHNLRNLYRRWAAFMEAESWDELAAWRRPESAKRTNGQSDRSWGQEGRHAMSGIINLRLLEPGTTISLSDGSTAEVVSNPLDGVWVFARYLSSPNDSSVVGTEEMIFAQNIVEILNTP
jgi:hypothetical protein